MHAANTLARLPATRPGLATGPGAWVGAAFAVGRRWLASAPREWVAEMIVLAVVSASIALMVVLAGAALDRQAASATLITYPTMLDPVSQVDIRDGVVANGLVTPYMERVNGTPDP